MQRIWHEPDSLLSKNLGRLWLAYAEHQGEFYMLQLTFVDSRHFLHHQRVCQGSPACDVVLRTTSHAQILGGLTGRGQSPEYAKFWIFQIGPLLAGTQPILWNNVTFLWSYYNFIIGLYTGESQGRNPIGKVLVFSKHNIFGNNIKWMGIWSEVIPYQI